MDIREKRSLSVSKLAIAIYCFFWMFPQGLALMFSSYSSLINAIKCFLWGIMLFSVIVKRIHITKFTKRLHLFWLIFLVCIVFSDFTTVNINTWLTLMCSVCGMALLFERYSSEKVICVLYRYMFMLVVINTILCIIMPQGFTYFVSAYDGLNKFQSHSNFISTDNNYAPFVLSYLIVGELYHDYYYRSQRSYILMWLFAWISMLIIFSATGITGLSVYSVVICMRRRKGKHFQLKLWHIAALLITLFVLVYEFNIQRLFSWIIVYVLGKDLTFTQRIDLWERAIEMIREKPIFGYGNLRYGSIILRNHYYWYSHNLILDILLEGGFVTLVGFTMLMSSFASGIKRFIKSRSIQLVLYSFIAMAVVNLTESYFSSVYFYMPFMLAIALCNKSEQLG